MGPASTAADADPLGASSPPSTAPGFLRREHAISALAVAARAKHPHARIIVPAPPRVPYLPYRTDHPRTPRTRETKNTEGPRSRGCGFERGARGRLPAATVQILSVRH